MMDILECMLENKYIGIMIKINIDIKVLLE